MTVKELIELLKNCSPEKEVLNDTEDMESINKVMESENAVYLSN